MARVPRPAADLWRLDEVPVAEVEAFQMEFRDVYRHSGADAAREALDAAMSDDNQSTLAQYLRYKHRR